MKSFIWSAGLLAFFVTPAFAAELIVKNCDGSIMAASQMSATDSGSFDVVVDSSHQGSATEQTVSLVLDSSPTTIKKVVAVHGAKAAFTAVPVGEYRACLEGDGLVSKINFVERLTQTQRVGAVFGLTALGAGGLVAAHRGGGGGGGQNTLLAADSGLAAGSEDTVQVSVPEVTTTGGHTPTSINSPSCSKLKRKAGKSVSALDADDCGEGLTPDPLSPYK